MNSAAHCSLVQCEYLTLLVGQLVLCELQRVLGALQLLRAALQFVRRVRELLAHDAQLTLELRAGLLGVTLPASGRIELGARLLQLLLLLELLEKSRSKLRSE